MRKLLIAFVPALLFAACSGHDHGAASDHPLGGMWVQDTGSEAKGFGLQFNTKGTDCDLHTAPRADGTHDHEHGSYTFDATTKAVTVTCKLLGPGKAEAWAGTLGVGVLELTGGADKVTLKPGKIAGH